LASTQITSVDDATRATAANTRPTVAPRVTQDAPTAEGSPAQINSSPAHSTAAAFRHASTQRLSENDGMRAAVTNAVPLLIPRVRDDDQAPETPPGQIDQLGHDAPHFAMIVLSDSCSALLIRSQRSHATGSINFVIAFSTQSRRSLGSIASSSQQRSP
jgi:hypothetical protein